jgi:hypothetical protein
VRALRCADGVQAGRELLLRGLAAWGDAAGSARALLSGVFAGGIAGDAPAAENKEQAE